MSSEENCISDYVEGVSFEIGEAFFPPPVIVLPPPPDPPQNFKPYNFVAENSAIAAYAEFLQAKRDETSASNAFKPSSGSTQNSPQITTPNNSDNWNHESFSRLRLSGPADGLNNLGSSAQSDSLERYSQSDRASSSNNYSVAGPSAPIPSTSAAALPKTIMSNLGGRSLTPWMGPHASGSTGILEPQPFQGLERRPSAEQPPRAQRLISLEDFESSANPFDTLEIKTMDDRALLRQILDSR